MEIEICQKVAANYVLAFYIRHEVKYPNLFSFWKHSKSSEVKLVLSWADRLAAKTELTARVK